MATLDQLRAELSQLQLTRARLTAEVVNIDNRHDGALPAGVQERWNNVTAGAANVDVRIAEINAEIEARAAQGVAARAALARGAADGFSVESGDGARGFADFNVGRDVFAGDPWEPTRGGQVPSDVRDRSLAAVEKTPFAADGARELATRLVERESGEPGDPAARWALVTSDPAYFRAVSKLFHDPERGFLEWSEGERHAFSAVKNYQRTMLETGAGTANFLTPFLLDPAINLTNSGTISSIRKVARVEQVTQMTWHGVTSAGSTASWDGEGVEVSDDSPTLTQPSVVTYKGAAFIAASIEVVQDAANLGADVARLIADAADRLSATAFVSGTGSTPLGSVSQLYAQTSSRVNSATNGAYNVVDVYNLLEAVPPRHRPGATFHMGLPFINKTRRFAEGLGNNSSFLSDLSADAPPRLIGKPLYEESEMIQALSTSTASNDLIVVCGDFRNYLIADRVGTAIEFVPLLLGPDGRPNGTRGWYGYFRTGADWLNPDAGRVLVA